jgi:hypothetical protein
LKCSVRPQTASFGPERRFRSFEILGIARYASGFKIAQALLRTKIYRLWTDTCANPQTASFGPERRFRSFEILGIARYASGFKIAQALLRTKIYRLWTDNRSCLKKWILVQGQGGREFQPGGILLYFEDLERAPNAEIEPKDFFEIASNNCIYP